MSSVLYLLVAVIAFAITAALGKWMIPFLHKLKFGQTIREVGPSWHKNKQGTPTMGGLMFILGIVVAMMACLPVFYTLGMEETLLMKAKVFAGLGMAVAFGAIGFMDDYISILKKRNLGLTERQKLVLQFAVAAAYLVTIRLAGAEPPPSSPSLGGGTGLVLLPLGCCGHCGHCQRGELHRRHRWLEHHGFLLCLPVLALCAGILSMTGLSALGMASAAACIGFLIWNWHPAKVFMGDTGSLFMGGMVCALAFGMDLPILLLPVGFVYLCEILSVVLQVSYFKATHGKRLFKMSPIHHHFECVGGAK